MASLFACISVLIILSVYRCKRKDTSYCGYVLFVDVHDCVIQQVYDKFYIDKGRSASRMLGSHFYDKRR